MELEFFYFLISLLIAGFFSGFLAGLLGIGGGLVVIPIIYYILNFYDFSQNISIHVAIASSLGVIFLTSISSIYAHYKLDNIKFHIVRKWSIGIILGSFIGAIFASSVSGNFLILVFCLIASFVAISMFLNFNVVFSNDIPKNLLFNNVISFFIGYFSVLIGIGGGSFSVPILTIFGQNMRSAVGTSATIGFFIALPGLIAYFFMGLKVEELPNYSIGYICLPVVFAIASVSIFTAPIGAKISVKMNKKTLKKIFGFFLLLICISLVIDNYY